MLPESDGDIKFSSALVKTVSLVKRPAWLEEVAITLHREQFTYAKILNIDCQI